MSNYKHKLYIYDNNYYHAKEVIDAICFSLNMHSYQAEQCVEIAHNVGKSVIKESSKAKLLELKNELRITLPELVTEIVKID